jgi:hypothetical protein
MFVTSLAQISYTYLWHAGFKYNFFCIRLWGETHVSLNCGRFYGPIVRPGVRMNKGMSEWMNGWMKKLFFYVGMWSPRWNDIDRENRRTRRKTCPSATLSTTNLTGLTRAAAVWGRRLTAWAMSRPKYNWIVTYFCLKLQLICCQAMWIYAVFKKIIILILLKQGFPTFFEWRHTWQNFRDSVTPHSRWDPHPHLPLD